jgi:hypothetical protein
MGMGAEEEILPGPTSNHYIHIQAFVGLSATLSVSSERGRKAVMLSTERYTHHLAMPLPLAYAAP